MRIAYKWFHILVNPWIHRGRERAAHPDKAIGPVAGQVSSVGMCRRCRIGPFGPSGGRDGKESMYEKTGSPADSLEGQFLIAMPSMGDPRFERAVIYLCAHSQDGAMGFVINQIMDRPTLPDFMRQLSIVTEGEDIEAS